MGRIREAHRSREVDKFYPVARYALRHWSGENIANDPAVDFGQAKVLPGGAAKLRAADNQCVVEQAALLQSRKNRTGSNGRLGASPRKRSRSMVSSAAGGRKRPDAGRIWIAYSGVERSPLPNQTCNINEIIRGDSMPAIPFDRDAMANWYARQHRSTDPGIQQIYYLTKDAPAREIRFIEINHLLADMSDDALEPIDFGVDTGSDNEHKLFVLDVTPSQWSEIDRGRLSLPTGWTLEGAITLGDR
jgi:hypothetical protein